MLPWGEQCVGIAGRGMFAGHEVVWYWELGDVLYCHYLLETSHQRMRPQPLLCIIWKKREETSCCLQKEKWG